MLVAGAGNFKEWTCRGVDWTWVHTQADLTNACEGALTDCYVALDVPTS